MAPACTSSCDSALLLLQVRESILGFDVPELSKDELAWEAGFGSVYWMEGVVTRLQDRHGGASRSKHTSMQQQSRRAQEQQLSVRAVLGWVS